MPLIELRGDETDPGYIFALMDFPSDPDMRRRALAVWEAESAVQECERLREVEVRIRPATLRDLLAAPSAQQLKETRAECTKRGFIAGEFLFTVYMMACFPKYFDEPSISKAIFLTQERAKTKTGQFGDGTPMPTSESAIRKCVDEFRSVAHLWGALAVRSRSANPRLQDSSGSLSSILDFLGLAATLQEFGCAFVAKRVKNQEPILDRRTLWIVPDSIPRQRPKGKGPSAWIVEASRKYRARRR